MTKADFVVAMVEKTGLQKKQCENALNACLETIQEVMVSGDKINFTGFGSFEVKERAERNGVNPSTGDKIVIPASKRVAFKVGKNLKEAVNK